MQLKIYSHTSTLESFNTYHYFLLKEHFRAQVIYGKTRKVTSVSLSICFASNMYKTSSESAESERGITLPGIQVDVKACTYNVYVYLRLRCNHCSRVWAEELFMKSTLASSRSAHSIALLTSGSILISIVSPLETGKILQYKAVLQWMCFELLRQKCTCMCVESLI